MNFKTELTAAMNNLDRDPLVRFIGYGVTYGKAMGTLNGVSQNKLIELPVAENLMVGFAIGLALKGLKPVVFFERYDFVLNAMDALVNHLDKITTISGGEFNPNIILRVVVGNSQKPLFTGKTHTSNYSAALEQMVNFPVVRLSNPECIQKEYAKALAELPYQSSCLIEYKDRI
jgi:pyruvate dehydrogenase E1 component beta subunit